MYAKILVTLLLINHLNNIVLSNNHIITEKIFKAGFEFEEHKIITEDGYINTAWRIPKRIGEVYISPRKPVMLQHGILDDSWTFFALKAEDCLPIMLAEEGYDVWITNSRGNIFSNDHINKDLKSDNISSKYWDFTFYEMAKYDFPAFVEHIRKTTNFEKIIYIGHSQGTFQYFLNYLIDPSFIESRIERYVSIGTVVTVFNMVMCINIVCSYSQDSKLY